MGEKLWSYEGWQWPGQGSGTHVIRIMCERGGPDASEDLEM